MAIVSRLDSSGNFSIANTGVFDEYTIPTSSYSVSFSGGSQRLTVPSNAAFTMGTGAFTLEAWVYRTATSFVAGTSSNIFDFRSAEPQVAIQLYYDPVAGKILLWVNGSVVITGLTTNNTNIWYHIALVRSSTTTTLYVNGISDGTYSDSNNYATTGLTIGGRFAAVTGDYRCWQGYISNARIVKGTAVYTSNFTVPLVPLTAISGTSLLTCQSATIIDNGTANGGNPFTITNNGTSTTNTTIPKFARSSIQNDGTCRVFGIYDEVTINPISSGIARRQYSNGDYFIAGVLDEITGIV